MTDTGPRPYSLSGEAMALAQAASGQSGKLRTRISRLWKLRRAYRRLFFDENGALREDARLVLADLAEQAGIARGAPVLDHGYLCELEGRRKMMLHIVGSFKLPENELAEMERDLARMEEPDK